MDIATFGLKIAADTSGAKDFGAALDAVGAKAEKTTSKVDLHRKALDHNLQSALSLARGLGPLGEHSERVGIALERAGARMAIFTEQSSKARTAHEALTQAHRAGLITTANLEGAQNRLTAARKAAVDVENAITKATQVTKAAQQEAAAVARAIQTQTLNIAQAKQAMDAREKQLLTGKFSTQKEYDSLMFKQKAQAEQIAAAEKNLMDLRLSHASSTETFLKAQRQLNALREEEKRINAEVAESQKLVSIAQDGVGKSMLALTGVIAGVVVVLAGLVVAYESVKHAIDFVKESLKAGLGLEKSMMELEAITGSTKKAEAAYESFNETARHTKFEIPELITTYDSLNRFARAGADVNVVLKDMTVIAAGPAGNLQGLAKAFEQIEITGKIIPLTMRSFKSAGFDLQQALADQMHKSSDEIMNMAKNGKIHLEDVARAMHSAAAEGGYFSRLMESMGSTTSQAWKTLSHDWEELQAKFGKPLNIALAPLLKELDGLVLKMTPEIEKIGEKFGAAMRIVTQAIKDGEAHHLFQLLWEHAIDMVHDYMVRVLKAAITEAVLLPINAVIKAWDLLKKGTVEAIRQAAEVVKAATDGAVDGAKFLGVGGQDDLNKRIARGKELDALLNKLNNESTPKPVELPPNPARAPANPGGKEDDGKATEIAKDADIMKDYNAQLVLMRQSLADGSMKQAEFNRRVFELKDGTAKELADPMAYAKSLDYWRAYQAEKVKAEQEADDQIKNGTASMATTVQRSLQKLSESFGNWQQMAEKAITGIGNAIVNDISSNLSAIEDGTKSVAQGFKDMAVSILKDIANIIQKLIIELIVVNLVNAALGKPSVGIGQIPSMGGKGYATGGRITGGSGNKDDVPAMLTGGEYVIKRSSAQAIGYDNLDKMNNRGSSAHALDKGAYSTGKGDGPGFPGGNLPDLVGTYVLNQPQGGTINWSSGGGGSANPFLPTDPGGMDGPMLFGGGSSDGPSVDVSGRGGMPGNPSVTASGGDPTKGPGGIGRTGNAIPGFGAPGVNAFGGSFFAWTPNTNNVTGWGTSAPSGVYAPGGGPTVVPTFWGSGGGDNPVGAGVGWGLGGQGSGNYGGAGPGFGGIENTGSVGGWGSKGAPIDHFANGGRVRRYHTGGIVEDDGLHFASGGEVPIIAQRGEGVFTPGQMAQMAPAGGGATTNHITVTVNNHGGSSDSDRSSSGSDEKARDLARQVEAAVNATIEKQQRFRGRLYRTQEGVRN